MRGRAGESHTAWASPPQCDKEDTRDSIPQRRTTQLDDPSAVRQAGMRRVFATLSLVLCASAVGIVVVDAVTAFPRGLLIGSALVAATVVAWAGLRRRGTARGALLALGAALFVAA